MNHRSNESAQWSSCCWGHGWRMKSGQRQDTQSLRRGIQGTLCSVSKEVRQQETMLLQLLSYRGRWQNYLFLSHWQCSVALKLLHTALSTTSGKVKRWAQSKQAIIDVHQLGFLGKSNEIRTVSLSQNYSSRRHGSRTADGSALSTYLWLQRKELPALCHCCPRETNL